MNPSGSQNRLSTHRLRRRTPGSFLLVPCPRLERSIRCQGQLEAMAAMILANCPLLGDLQEQPLQIWYAWRETSAGPQIRLLDQPPQRRRMGGCRTSYVVPDFLVQMRQKSVRLVEVKPSRQLDKPLVQRKLAVARAYAVQQGWKYHVLTEKELRNGPLLENVRLMARYRKSAVESGLCDRFIKFISGAGAEVATLDQFAQSIKEPHPAQLQQVLFHLLATGRLDCNPIADRIGIHTRLYLGGTQPWDPFDSVWGPNGCGRAEGSASFVNSPPDGSSSGM